MGCSGFTNEITCLSRPCNCAWCNSSFAAHCVGAGGYCSGGDLVYSDCRLVRDYAYFVIVMIAFAFLFGVCLYGWRTIAKYRADDAERQHLIIINDDDVDV